MPFVPVPDCLEVVCHQSFLDEEIVNVWHVDASFIPDPLPFVDADAIQAEFGKFYQNLSTAASPNRGIIDDRATTAVFDKITVRDIRTSTVTLFEFIYNGAGTNNGDPLPLEDAAVVTLNTGVSGRHARGRVYLAPFTENALIKGSNGQPLLDSAFQTRLSHAVGDLNTRLGALTDATQLVVASRHSATHAPAARFVTGIKIGNVWRAQRRRQNKSRSSNTVVATI